MVKISDSISGILLYILYLCGVILYCIGGIHSYRKHSGGDLVFCILIPPWGLYRGIESFWHKNANSLSYIDWNKRIPDDIYTCYELIINSEDKTNVDNNRMQIEEMAKKLVSYPSDSTKKIENGVKSYMHFLTCILNDNLAFLNKKTNDSSLTFNYSNQTKTIYDSIYNYYHSQEVSILKSEMDSVFKSLYSSDIPKDEIQLRLNRMSNSMKATSQYYHIAFKKIFNEDYIEND